MMKGICLFYDNSIRVIVDSSKRSEQKMSMAQIEMYLNRDENGTMIDGVMTSIMEQINSMKFIDPITPKEEMKRQFDDLHSLINKGFNEMGTQGVR